MTTPPLPGDGRDEPKVEGLSVSLATLAYRQSRQYCHYDEGVFIPMCMGAVHAGKDYCICKYGPIKPKKKKGAKP